jgi:general secretion pathway protein E
LALKKAITKTILREKLLTEEQLEECLEISSTSGITLDQVFLQKNYLKEINVLRVLSKSMGLELYESLAVFEVPNEFIEKVPATFARQYNLVGIKKQGGVFQVATCTPLNLQPLDDLGNYLNTEIEPVLASRAEIISKINVAYQRVKTDMNELIDALDDGGVEAGQTLEVTDDLLSMSNQPPVIRLVNTVLFNALKMRASDIHFQPFEDKLQIRYRVDGILYDQDIPPKRWQDAIVSRIKVMGKMDIAERRIPQDGRASVKVGDNEVDLRISSLPTSYGERIVMRILDKGARVYTINELGLEERNSKILLKAISQPNGVIFVTGPTGSGKTTTLYASLSYINSTELNVITIEDPVEYNLPGISQIQVSNRAGMSFSAGLRSILRQDPDIVMVGEVRDEETARIAIQASLTGHLVFSTLHTNDSASAVTRMLDIGVEPYLVSSSLLLVVAQRLVRNICEFCKAPYTPSLEELEDIGITESQLPKKGLRQGKGCPRCFNTGYTNRIGIYEMLKMSDTIRELILERASSAKIKRTALAQEMTSLRNDGIQKVLNGQTTISEVLRITHSDF